MRMHNDMPSLDDDVTGSSGLTSLADISRGTRKFQAFSLLFVLPSVVGYLEGSYKMPVMF